MMRPDANVAVYVCVTPVDMRKQAATLALIVEQTLKRNISSLHCGCSAMIGVIGSRSSIGSATVCACGASDWKAVIGSSSRGTSRARR